MIALTTHVPIEKIAQGLIFQQFYNGGDTIWGRAKDISVKIPGIAPILAKFHQRITEYCMIIEKGEYRRFLEIFQENIYPIEIDAILSKFQDSYTMLGSEMNMVMRITVLLGESLNQLQQHFFNKGIQIVKTILQQYMGIDQLENAMSVLKTLYGKNEKTISLLYSLMYLIGIMEIEHAPDMVLKTQQIILNTTNQLAQRILTEISIS